MMLQPADAPGRAGEGAPPAAEAPAKAGPAEGTTQQDGSAAGAEGQEGQQGLFGGMGMVMLVPILLFGVILLMQRGDKKRRTQLEDKLKKGDRVITRSGITGKVIEVSERTIRLEIAPGVNVTMVKNAVEGLDTGDDVKTGGANKDGSKDRGKDGAKDGAKDKADKDDGKKKKK
jgi:preprotein translocase subunit YajC